MINAFPSSGNVTAQKIAKMVRTSQPAVLKEYVKKVSSSAGIETVLSTRLSVMGGTTVGIKVMKSIVNMSVLRPNSNVRRQVGASRAHGSAMEMLTVWTEVMSRTKCVIIENVTNLNSDARMVNVSPNCGSVILTMIVGMTVMSLSICAETGTVQLAGEDVLSSLIIDVSLNGISAMERMIVGTVQTNFLKTVHRVSEQEYGCE